MPPARAIHLRHALARRPGRRGARRAPAAARRSRSDGARRCSPATTTPSTAADLRALVRRRRPRACACERIVRVGCPARGTLLASKRLDAYLSILNWCLELANIPVVPEVVDFLHEVARRRADPSELPGLEAMTPDSPRRSPGSTARASRSRASCASSPATSRATRSVSWVKTLLSDAFYWTDNDLVVQTRSMYGGAPRAKTASGSGARFLLDKGGKVSHFSYFSNERTVQAIASALLDDTPADFARDRPALLGRRGRERHAAPRLAVARSRGAGGAAPTAADRPAVFVHPGHPRLEPRRRDGKRIWLGFRFVNGLKLLAWDPATAPSVEPDGPIGSLYGDLIERLADSHEVIPFAYDWRRPAERRGAPPRRGGRCRA